MSHQGTRVAVFVRYGLNPLSWRERYENGEVVDETPYGYHLAEPDVSLEWTTDHPEGAVARAFRSFVRRILGFDLVHVWRNRALLASADAVWTHTEREHLAVATLKLLNPRRYRARSIAQSVWLWDGWSGLSPLHRWMYRRLLRQHDVELVHSRVNRDLSRAGVPGRTVVRVPFGTHPASRRTEPTAAARQTNVLVVGNDRHRDWGLLRDVAGHLPEMEFDIVSLSPAVSELRWPRNVRLRRLTQREILTTAYAQASVVAIPLIENAHASGATVAIEAMSAGLPVVASDTGGIDEYLEAAQGALVPVGDVAAFTAAVRAAAAAPMGDPEVAIRRGLSSADYVARLVQLTRSVLADESIDPALERFAPLATGTRATGSIAR